MFEKQYRSNDIKREIPTIIVGVSLYLSYGFGGFAIRRKQV